MTRIKVCGVTRVADAEMVAGAGVDWIGLNFWPKSKRHVDVKMARQLSDAARAKNAKVKIVGLFVNQGPEFINEVVESAALDYVQLHGDELPGFAARFGSRCIKALALSSEDDLARLATYSCPWKLVDTPTPERGGSGTLGDWDLAAQAAQADPNLWLAGGLQANNVAAAILAVRPYGVDVASGVETSPGIKNAEKVQSFVAAVRGAV